MYEFSMVETVGLGSNQPSPTLTFDLSHSKPLPRFNQPQIQQLA
ncbi:MAG: hypothetical protein ACI80I_002887 [Akkermansiaceae bacterium]|jgi:hypothetical protein